MDVFLIMVYRVFLFFLLIYSVSYSQKKKEQIISSVKIQDSLFLSLEQCKEQNKSLTSKIHLLESTLNESDKKLKNQSFI